MYKRQVVSKPQSQRLSKDSFRGHVVSTIRHGTLLPSHHGGTYLSTCICMFSNCWVGRSWDKRWELTPSHGFDLTIAGLLTLQHRGFCSLTRSTTTSLLYPRTSTYCIFRDFVEKNGADHTVLLYHNARKNYSGFY